MSNLDHKIKTAAGKVPLDLLPLRALFGPSRAFQHGTIKYEIGNYLRATDDAATANRYGGAALRHLADMQGLDGVFARPDAIDDESGLPHLDHLIATLLMLRSILIQSGRLPADPGPSRFVRGERVVEIVNRDPGPICSAPVSWVDDLANFAARESAAAEQYDGPALYVAEQKREQAERCLDQHWMKHPLGSPERVQAVEEHRAACAALTAADLNDPVAMAAAHREARK